MADSDIAEVGSFYLRRVTSQESGKKEKQKQRRRKITSKKVHCMLNISELIFYTTYGKSRTKQQLPRGPTMIFKQYN